MLNTQIENKRNISLLFLDFLCKQEGNKRKQIIEEIADNNQTHKKQKNNYKKSKEQMQQHFIIKINSSCFWIRSEQQQTIANYTTGRSATGRVSPERTLHPPFSSNIGGKQRPQQTNKQTNSCKKLNKFWAPSCPTNVASWMIPMRCTCKK